jgi:hypothetical protein
MKPSAPHQVPIIATIFMLILLAIDMYVLHSTYKFKKNRDSCPCAITPNTQKIMVLVSIIVFVGVINIVLIPLVAYLLNTDKKSLVIAPGLIGFIVYCIGIYYAYLLIKYTNELKNNKCLCVSENFKSYIHTYGVVRMTLALLPLAILLLVIIISLVNRLFA